jgi:hypothetical protein
VLSDNNGEFVIPNISLLTLNPAALIHSIIALYNASDTRFSETQEDNAFSILSLRDASFFKTQGISLVPPLLNIQTEPYGTVYDSCTKEPIPNVKISCEGTAVSKQGTVNDFRLTQNTGSDGFFSFYATPGKYTLNVESIHDGEDGNFIFPSRALSGQCETMRRNGDGIYSDVYCEDPLETIIIADKILHFDVPVDPTICGTADPDETVYLVRNDTGEIADQTTATPNGKFSFFVTNPNQYTVTTDTE